MCRRMLITPFVRDDRDGKWREATRVRGRLCGSTRGSHLSKRRGRGPAALLHGLMAPVSHLCHFAPLGGKRWRRCQERSVIITQSNSNNRLS